VFSLLLLTHFQEELLPLDQLTDTATSLPASIKNSILMEVDHLLALTPLVCLFSNSSQMVGLTAMLSLHLEIPSSTLLTIAK
jgi:hypothetical protein